MTKHNITLFAHFDRNNCIDTNTIRHLAALRDVSNHLVFISNSQLKAAELGKIDTLVEEIIIQPDNVGFDFYAWSTYMKKNRIKIQSFDSLTLVNSSIIGPISPLKMIYSSMEDFDYWGMTESYQIRKHLQSYFLFFRKKILTSDYFWQFFENIIPFSNVESIIDCYETSLTVYLERYFGKPGVVAHPKRTYTTYPIVKILSFNREPNSENIAKFRHFGLFKYIKIKEWINPILFFPEKVIGDGVPYVKVKLFTENPYKVNTKKLEKILLDEGFTTPNSHPQNSHDPNL